jgi:hypothetical protein
MYAQATARRVFAQAAGNEAQLRSLCSSKNRKKNLEDAARRAMEAGAPRPFFTADGQQREQLKKHARVYSGIQSVQLAAVLFVAVFAYSQCREEPWGKTSSDKTVQKDKDR